MAPAGAPLRMQPTLVETYSGYKADEYPVRFRIGEHKLEVMETEDRWYDPGFSYFRVFADDARRYILRQNVENGRWEVAQLRGGE
jgi:hypothetical protein